MCVFICDQVFFWTCILLLFKADVNWLPGSYGYSKQLVLKLLLLMFSLKLCFFVL